MLSLYRYVIAHADELGVDTERIGFAGDSAGASIAALVCNRCEEESLKPPCLQMLVYPLTDAEMATDSMKQFKDTPNWDSQANERMWVYYCGKDNGRRLKASPMHCELTRMIPKTYVETAEYDCLHDEGLLYAKKLKEAGAYVEINETKGTFHGWYVFVLPKEVFAWQRKEPTATAISVSARTADGRAAMWSDVIPTAER